jgi:hypothetical protein
MDRRQAKNVSEAAKTLAEDVAESYRVVSERSVEAQERGVRLSQEFFAPVITELGRQAESNRPWPAS